MAGTTLACWACITQSTWISFSVRCTMHLRWWSIQKVRQCRRIFSFHWRFFDTDTFNKISQFLQFIVFASNLFQTVLWCPPWVGIRVRLHWWIMSSVLTEMKMQIFMHYTHKNNKEIIFLKTYTFKQHFLQKLIWKLVDSQQHIYSYLTFSSVQPKMTIT